MLRRMVKTIVAAVRHFRNVQACLAHDQDARATAVRWATHHALMVKTIVAAARQFPQRPSMPCLCSRCARHCGALDHPPCADGQNYRSGSAAFPQRPGMPGLFARCLRNSRALDHPSCADGQNSRSGSSTSLRCLIILSSAHCLIMAFPTHTG